MEIAEPIFLNQQIGRLSPVYRYYMERGNPIYLRREALE